MVLTTYAKVIWEDFVSLVFPNVCIGCSRSLVRHERYLCTLCMASLPTTNYHLTADNPIHPKFALFHCVDFATAFMHFRKGGVAQKILYEIKYRGNVQLGIALGTWLGESLRSDLKDYDLIVPTPIHPRKMRKRGFNQSIAIGKGLSNAISVPLASDAVRRIKNTSTQTNKSKVQRLQNVANMFEVDSETVLTGCSVIVLDDVITTGATLSYLCESLVHAGVDRIAVVAAASGA